MGYLISIWKVYFLYLGGVINETINEVLQKV
jgi:hypothetical protein